MTENSARCTGPHCPEREGVLRIATLNVCTLKGKMPEVLQLAEKHSIDILCLQEVRLSADNLLAAFHAAKRSGWQFLASPCAINNAGAPTAGVAILSKWPVDKFVLPHEPIELQTFKGRWQCVRVHRPGLRPFFCANLYLHASDRRLANQLGRSLFEAIATCEKDAMFIGDWNCTPEEEPACSVLRSGRLHLADAVAGIEAVNAPTRTNGRHIDFALHTVRLVPHARNEFAGVADHFLITYDFNVTQLGPFYRVASPRALSRSSVVSSDEWNASFSRDAFEQFLRDADVQAAWNMLSDHAELLLRPLPGRRRSTIPSPTQVPKQYTKVERLQSVLERRLRRILRRIEEMRKPHASWRLQVKIQQGLLYLQKHFPELSGIELVGPQLSEVLEDCLQKEIAASREARLQAWRKLMDEDEASVIRWVKGADSHFVFATSEPNVPVHPQEKAEFFADSWSKIWQANADFNDGAIAPFLNWIPPGGFACSQPSINAGNLLSITKKSVGTAHGPDGWKGDHWALLPMEFFQDLANLWHVVLRSSNVPKQWLDVRCVLIPKDVGLRPISVASLAWRTGIGVLAQQLAHWIQSWAPEELVGGVKGRSAATVHEQLHTVICSGPLFVGPKSTLRNVLTMSTLVKL